MRRRTNMSGLVVSATPEGKARTSGRNKCEMNLKKLQKLIDDGYQIAGAKKIKPADNQFKLFGTLECKFEIPVEILIKAGFVK